MSEKTLEINYKINISDLLIIEIKNFDYKFFIRMWSHYRCLNEFDKSKVVHLIKDQKQYLKNPCHKIYKLVEPFFKKSLESNENIQLCFISNKSDTTGIFFSKYDNRPYVGFLQENISNILTTEFIDQEYPPSNYLFVFFKKVK